MSDPPTREKNCKQRLFVELSTNKTEIIASLA
jgi:hypothetical protein